MYVVDSNGVCAHVVYVCLCIVRVYELCVCEFACVYRILGSREENSHYNSFFFLPCCGSEDQKS